MNTESIMKIFDDTEYIRVGGSEAELKAAKYLKERAKELTGYEAIIESFPVSMTNMKSATLCIDGKEYKCKGYLCCGSGSVEGELIYIPDTERMLPSQCRGKIVLFDGYLGYWKFHDFYDAGAIGFISYDGNANYSDNDIDARELRSYVSQGKKLLGVNINAKDAMEIVASNAKTAKITVEQEEYEGSSQNVVLDIPAENAETIVFSAHYDSTSLSNGAYDNMSGCAGLLALAEYFSKNKTKRSMRFVFCGSEERGLLGSKAYCSAHSDSLSSVVLNINIDMIGVVMGSFRAVCTAESNLVSYMSYMSKELGIQLNPMQEIHSSDSTVFADNGVPAVSFARSAPANIATIHNSYDTKKVLKAETLLADIDFIRLFAERMANSQYFPIAREIPENVKSKIDAYFCRIRK